MKILFTPIGGTDPISNFHDGSFLHICRIYKPDKIIMFLSKEMHESQEKDGRYTYCIEKLGELLGHNFEPEIISKPDLCDVQKYDYFYREFRAIISKINSEMDKDDTLYLNVSSGTPAMKNALNVLATVSEYKFIPIQVSTPERKMNPKVESHKNYDVEANWECNEDNDPDKFVDRSSTVECFNLILIMKLDLIKKFIGVYDYRAARIIADEIKENLSENAYKLIKAAECRLYLDKSGITKSLSGTNYDIIPVKEGDKREIIEYLLALRIKIEKGELADFLRGITPVTVDLFEMFLKNRCGVDINDYCSVDKNRKRTWDENKLQQNQKLYDALSSDYKDGFKGTDVYSDHLLKIIEIYCKDFNEINCVKKLRDVERSVRNKAAHDIISVSDEWIKNQTKQKGEKEGLGPKEIFDIMKQLCHYSGLPGGVAVWKSYDIMNNKISDALGI